jgi:hypothetical protein
MVGIPTMVITRLGFTQVVGNAFAGFGFPAEGPVVYEFPAEMFLEGSDLTPIKDHLDAIVEGLTKWAPKINTKGLIKPDMVTVEGQDYKSAEDNVNYLFLKNQWRDGLQITPPTEDQVNWILTGTDLDPNTEISPKGGVVPRGGIATVQTIAVSLAMAGGRPEYLPLLIAAVKAMTDTKMMMQNWNATTCSVIPAFIVNGPIAKQIRIGSGYGLLGPDPVHPAGEAIGRAIRLIQQDLGGAIPGQGTMAIFGGMRATNAVFAEDEGGLPKGWNSLAVDRGFTSDKNVVTTSLVGGMSNCIWFFGTKETNDQSLMEMAGMMEAPNPNRYSHPEMFQPDNPDLCSGLVFMPRGFAASMASTSGYSKTDVKKFLWDHSKMPWSQVVATGQKDSVTKLKLFTAGQVVPVTPKADQLTILVAGGDQSGHGYWMQPVTQGNMVSEEIELPKKWDDLLKQAETDLGPLPAVH